MPVTIDLKSVEGVAVGVAKGVLTLAEIKQSAATVWKTYGGQEARLLWDLREAEFNLSPSEIREWARYSRDGSPYSRVRIAFVVLRDLHFGLVSMFEVFRQADEVEMSVFRDFDEALEWLGQDTGASS